MRKHPSVGFQNYPEIIFFNQLENFQKIFSCVGITGKSYLVKPRFFDFFQFLFYFAQGPVPGISFGQLFAINAIIIAKRRGFQKINH